MSVALMKLTIPLGTPYTRCKIIEKGMFGDCPQLERLKNDQTGELRYEVDTSPYKLYQPTADACTPKLSSDCRLILDFSKTQLEPLSFQDSKLRKLLADTTQPTSIPILNQPIKDSASNLSVHLIPFASGLLVGIIGLLVLTAFRRKYSEKNSKPNNVHLTSPDKYHKESNLRPNDAFTANQPKTRSTNSTRDLSIEMINRLSSLCTYIEDSNKKVMKRLDDLESNLESLGKSITVVQPKMHIVQSKATSSTTPPPRAGFVFVTEESIKLAVDHFDYGMISPFEHFFVMETNETKLDNMQDSVFFAETSDGQNAEYIVIPCDEYYFLIPNIKSDERHARRSILNSKRIYHGGNHESPLRINQFAKVQLVRRDGFHWFKLISCGQIG